MSSGESRDRARDAGALAADAGEGLLKELAGWLTPQLGLSDPSVGAI